MPLPRDALGDLADAALDAVVDYYTVNGLDLPSRRFVFNGQQNLATAIGCEQLAIAVTRTDPYPGNILDQSPQAIYREAGHAMRLATICVNLSRCVPTIEGGPAGAKMTDPADETDRARLVYADSIDMENALLTAERAGDLGRCHNVAFLDWSCLGSEGGMATGVLRMVGGLE